MARKKKRKTPRPSSAPLDQEPKQARKKPSKPSSPKSLLYLIPAIFGLLLYINTTSNGFTLDDPLVLSQNKFVQEGTSGIGDLFTHNYFAGGAPINDGVYRPLPTIMFALEVELAVKEKPNPANPNGPPIREQAPGFHHFMNALLYGLAGFWLFLLMKDWFPNRHVLLPLIITLLYLAHPLHTDAVSGVKGRDEILAFLFFLPAARYSLKYVNSNQILHLGIAVISFALAFLSKESALTYVVIIPLSLWFFSQANWKKIATVAGAITAMGVLLLLWRQHVINSMDAPMDEGITSLLSNSFAETSGLDRIASAAYLQLVYLYKLLLPLNFSHDYSFNQIPAQGIGSPMALLGLVVVIGSLAFAVIRGLKKDPIAFGILFYFITMATAANLFLLIGVTMADRLTFTSSLGFVMVVGLVLARVFKWEDHSAKDPLMNLIKNQGATTGIVAVALLFFSFQTINRNGDWESNETLYTADIQYADKSAKVNYNYGTMMSDKGKATENAEEKKKYLTEAKKYLKKAIDLYPKYNDAMNNLGNTYQIGGQRDSAIYMFRQIIDKIEEPKEYPNAFFNLGINLQNDKQYEEAAGHFRTYVSLVRNKEVGWSHVANCYTQMGQHEKAVEAYMDGLKDSPNSPRLLLELGTAYATNRQIDLAYEQFLLLTQAHPQNPEGWFNLAMVHLNRQNLEEARRCLRQTLAIQPNHAQAQQQLKNIGG